MANVDIPYRPGPFVKEWLDENMMGSTTELFEAFKARLREPREMVVPTGEPGRTEISGYYHKVPTYDSFRRYLHLFKRLGLIRVRDYALSEREHLWARESTPENVVQQQSATWELTDDGRRRAETEPHWVTPWAASRKRFGWGSTSGWPEPTEGQKARLKEFQTKHRHLRAAGEGHGVGVRREHAPALPRLPRRIPPRRVVEEAIYGPPRPEYVERERELAELRRAHRLRGVAARQARQRLEQQWASLHGVGVGASVRLEDDRVGTVTSIAEGMASVEIEGAQHVVPLASLRPA